MSERIKKWAANYDPRTRAYPSAFNAAGAAGRRAVDREAFRGEGNYFLDPEEFVAAVDAQAVIRTERIRLLGLRCSSWERETPPASTIHLNADSRILSAWDKALTRLIKVSRLAVEDDYLDLEAALSDLRNALDNS